MRYATAKRKLLLERIAMWPWVALGKWCGYLFPLKTKHGVFLFFSNADIGGSPRVNANIAQCLRQHQPLVIFCKKPTNNGFQNLFEINGIRVMDLHKKIDNKLLHLVNFFYRGLLASWIHQQQNPTVFGGECIFFYKIIPHLKKQVQRAELNHVHTWLPYSIGFIDNINIRICSTQHLLNKIKEQYLQQNLPSHFANKLVFIDNAMEIPHTVASHNPTLQVVYIGRGAAQKRVHLIAAMAKKMYEQQAAVHFSFVGHLADAIDQSTLPYCRFYGNISQEAALQKIYEQSDVLLLTSAYEGLPLVVMQMMAYGKVVLSTAVNAIPDYIKHLHNGLLITQTEEAKIVEQGVQHLQWLIANPQLRIQLGNQSRATAIATFSPAVFCKKYHQHLCLPF